MQICTLPQTDNDNHVGSPPLSFLTGQMPFLLATNQQHQSTDKQTNMLIIIRLVSMQDMLHVESAHDQHLNTTYFVIVHQVHTDSKIRFFRTWQDLQRLNSRVFQDSQNSFQGCSRIYLVHKHGCKRSKKCTYQISYRCNCITVNKPKCFWNPNWPKRWPHTHTTTEKTFYNELLL